MKLKHIVTKGLVRRKIKPFVNLFSMAYGKNTNFKTISNGIFNLFKKGSFR
jgi:hypothetical protein